MKLIYAIRCSFWRLLRFHFLKLWSCNLFCQSFIGPKYLVCHGSQSEALTPFRLSCDDGSFQNFEDEFLFVILPCHIKMTTQFHKLSSLQHFGIGLRSISLPVIFPSSGTLISLISIFGKTDWNTVLYNHEIAHKYMAHTYTHWQTLSTYAFRYWSTILFLKDVTLQQCIVGGQSDLSRQGCHPWPY